jgi:hypothetical protein
VWGERCKTLLKEKSKEKEKKSTARKAVDLYSMAMRH